MTTTLPPAPQPHAVRSADVAATRERGPISPRRAALVAGAGYVALFVLAMFANFFVIEELVVSGDPSATAANIVDRPGLFRLGIVAFVAVFVIDVVVAWALFVVFRERDRDLSLLAAWFRLAYTVMLGVGAVFLVQALQLVDRVGFLAELDAADLQAQALVALDMFDTAWLVGLVAFGLHLILLGTLLIRSQRGPRLLAMLLVVAGVAYVVDTTAHLLLSNYEQYGAAFLAMVAIPSVIAEGWFGLWLLLTASRTSTGGADGS